MSDLKQNIQVVCIDGGNRFYSGHFPLNVQYQDLPNELKVRGFPTPLSQHTCFVKLQPIAIAKTACTPKDKGLRFF